MKYMFIFINFEFFYYNFQIIKQFLRNFKLIRNLIAKFFFGGEGYNFTHDNKIILIYRVIKSGQK